MSKLTVKQIPCTLKWYDGAMNRVRITEKETEMSEEIINLIMEQNSDLVEIPYTTTVSNKTKKASNTQDVEIDTLVEDEEQE